MLRRKRGFILPSFYCCHTAKSHILAKEAESYRLASDKPYAIIVGMNGIIDCAVGSGKCSEPPLLAEIEYEIQDFGVIVEDCRFACDHLIQYAGVLGTWEPCWNSECVSKL